jgi:hypothetical protein
MTDVAIQPVLFGMEQAAKTSDDYYTPAWVFERMGIEFDLDVSSPLGGIPWIPAKRYFTMADDGLSQPWTGRVWMNPPFSRGKHAGRPADHEAHTGVSAWVDRFLAHKWGVCLLPHSRARWHSRIWASDAAIADPRPFDTAVFGFYRDGSSCVQINYPVFLAAFGEECIEAISRLGRVRR